MTTTHELKTWPEPFAAVLDGSKTYEIRVDDRGFKVGDRLRLREYDPHFHCDRITCIGRYTGREILVEVTHLSPGGSWGLPANMCVMAIRRVEAPDRPLDPRHREVLQAMLVEHRRVASFLGPGVPNSEIEREISALAAVLGEEASR